MESDSIINFTFWIYNATYHTCQKRKLKFWLKLALVMMLIQNLWNWFFLSVDTISLNQNGRKRFRFDWLLILFPSSGCQTHIEDFKLHRLLLNSFLSISKAILDFLWNVIWWVVYLLPEFYLIISPDFFPFKLILPRRLGSIKVKGHTLKY